MKPGRFDTNRTPAKFRPRAQTIKAFVLLVALTLASVRTMVAQGTAFTYQGRFTDNGAPYTGNVEIQATLWDAVSGGSQIAANAPAQVVVAVTNGLFVVPLNFGANFPGANRWLQLEVRTNLSAFTPLTPRQPLTPTPYAITAGNLSGPVASANLAGTYSSALTFNNAANSFSGSGAGLTALDAGQLTSGAVPDARLGVNVARTNQVWLLGGNTGVAPGANFLGTTDNQPLELRVNGARAFRLEPNATSPNVIGGYVSNSVSPGVYGATIAGGGRDGFIQTITAHHGTIGGGDRNTVSGEDGTIAGGGANIVAGNYASIGGGLFNNNLAYLGTISGGANHRIGNNANSGVIAGGFAHSIGDNAFDGTIGGGSYNSIGTNSAYGTISGGRSNAVQSNASSSTIGGGYLNTIQPNAVYATIGGGVENTIQPYANKATIAGGYFNTIETYGDVATIGGGYANTIQFNAQRATIAGGDFNLIQPDALAATIGGGSQNMIQTSAWRATIGGGYLNTIQPSATYATLGGGYINTIQTSADFATIGGGRDNTIQTSADFATIGGGFFNMIQSDAVSATIGGGSTNTIQTNAISATIGGGNQNTIQPFADYATLGGGWYNTIQADADYASIGGGWQNTIETNATYATIGGGIQNTIQPFAYYATIGGGYMNTIQPFAFFATIPGGALNNAASHAFAAGYRAKANHTGAFVWADTQGSDFASTAVNQFCIRASGGVHLSGDTPMFFGSTLSQKINLYGTNFGIGVQNSVQYSRVGVGSGFGWYAGGVHNENTFNSGGGTTLMTLTTGGLAVNGLFVHASDRNLKENFAPVQPREMLEKVLALPLSSWNLKADPATRHVGPMAQDFYAAFNLGPDDKHIATVDADGVALAAIQGLNQKLTDELKRRDAENAEAQKQIRLLRERLERLEKLEPKN